MSDRAPRSPYAEANFPLLAEKPDKLRRLRPLKQPAKIVGAVALACATLYGAFADNTMDIAGDWHREQEEISRDVQGVEKQAKADYKNKSLITQYNTGLISGSVSGRGEYVQIPEGNGILGFVNEQIFRGTVFVSTELSSHCLNETPYDIQPARERQPAGITPTENGALITPSVPGMQSLHLVLRTETPLGLVPADEATNRQMMAYDCPNWSGYAKALAPTG